MAFWDSSKSPGTGPLMSVALPMVIESESSPVSSARPEQSTPSSVPPGSWASGPDGPAPPAPPPPVPSVPPPVLPDPEPVLTVPPEPVPVDPPSVVATSPPPVPVTPGPEPLTPAAVPDPPRVRATVSGATVLPQAASTTAATAAEAVSRALRLRAPPRERVRLVALMTPPPAPVPRRG